MSLLDSFSENTEIFRGDEKRIDQAAFDALVEKHGLEFAQGYLKAMHEVTQIVGNIMRTPPLEGSKFPGFQTPTTVYGKMYLLHKALYSFVEKNGLDTSRIRPPRVRHGTNAIGW